MRGPAAVLGWSAERADGLAPPHGIAHGAPVERGVAEVTVEREERRAAVGTVFEDDRRAVVEREVVVGEAVDRAVERSEDGRTGGLEEVHPEVDRAERAVLRREELVAGVNQPRFVVAADPDLSPGRSYPPLDHVGGKHRGDE